MPDDLESRLVAFMTEYAALCHKHGMEISTTQDGGQTIAVGGSNISGSGRLPDSSRRLWPNWDYEAQEYVTSAEAATRRRARIDRDQEIKDRRDFERLSRKFAAEHPR